MDFFWNEDFQGGNLMFLSNIRKIRIFNTNQHGTVFQPLRERGNSVIAECTWYRTKFFFYRKKVRDGIRNTVSVAKEIV